MKRQSMQSLWIKRYIITLLTAILIIAFIYIVWNKENIKEHRLSLVQTLNDSIAVQTIGNQDKIKDQEIHEQYNDILKSFNATPKIIITDHKGQWLNSNFNSVNETRINTDILERENDYDIISTNDLNIPSTDHELYMLKTPIESDNETYGYVISFVEKNKIDEVHIPFVPILLIAIPSIIIGTILIYYFTRQMTTPIHNISSAARKLSDGEFVTIDSHYKEKELYDFALSFNELSKQLEAHDQLRNELLAGVTHELKTPVASISGLLQAIQDDIVDETDKEEFIKLSLQESRKLNRLIEDLLVFNSFTTDAIKINSDQINLKEFIESTVTHFDYQSDNQNSIIECHNLIDASIHTDRDRLSQVLLNLLNNANQASHRDSTIEIHMNETLDAYNILIKDFGSGIPKDDIEHIFEKFYRGQNKRYDTRGFGLGLPLCKLIMQKLNGNIQLFETSSEGTTFIIKLNKKGVKNG